MGDVSAVAYFFARRLQESVHVPIGLIQEAVGGVPAETFASADALRPLKDFDAGIAEIERRRQAGDPEYGNYIMRNTLTLVFGMLVVSAFQAFSAAQGGATPAARPSAAARTIAPYLTPAASAPKAPDADGFLQRWLLLEPISRPNRSKHRIYRKLHPERL